MTEDEIQYLVNEAASCLSADIRLRRSDVLSAWQGWRPLYRDPNSPPDAPVSRHHAIGHDENTGVTFICGGKWSTYRAMAEELVDKVIAFKGDKLKHAGPCTTREIKLLGGEGYHKLLYVQLVQNYGVSEAVAKHLTHAYGSAAFAVCELAKPTGRTMSTMGVPTDGGAHVGRLVVPDYPYIEAEVLYACRHEMAVTVKDMLTIRMRLAYLNSEAAKQAISRVADLMAKELGWSKRERDRQIKEAESYIGAFGGPVADKSNATLKAATFTDLHDIFVSIDTDHSGSIEVKEFKAAATRLGFPFKDDAELQAKLSAISRGNKSITEAQFIEWWNGRGSSQGAMKRLQRTISLSAEGEVALDKTLFSDAAKPADEAGTDKNVKRALFSMQTEMAEKAKQKNDAEAIVKALEAEAKKK